MHLTLLLFALVAFQEGTPEGKVYESLSPNACNEFVIKLVGIMANVELQKELEIVPSQIAEIKDRITSAKEKYKEAYKAADLAYKETKDSSVYEKLQSDFREYVRHVETVLSDVLLPHQLEQLNRAVLWSMIKSEHAPVVFGQRQLAFRSVLEHDVVKEILEIDDAQSGEIQKRSNELQAEFAKDMAELHEKYEKRLREELTPAQSRKIKNMLGETPSFLYAAPKID